MVHHLPTNCKPTYPLSRDQAAINGTLNIMRQATKLGVKNFSVISSVGAVWDRNSTKSWYTSDGTIPFSRHVQWRLSLSRCTDWNPITREQILTETLEPLSTYSGSKTLAEHAVWEFAAEHPDINITVCKYTTPRLDAENPRTNARSQ